MNRVGDVGLAIAIFLMLDATWARCSTREVFARRRRAVGAGVARSRSRCCCCSARAASPASSRCRPGCRTRWRARPRSPRSSTRRRWSPRASTSSPGSHPIYDQTDDRPARRRDHRRDHPADRLHHRLRQGRHQEGAGLLDGQPDRLHVPRRRARPGRLRAGHHPPARPRLLQGRAVPRRRLGHARHERRGRHAPLRRAARVHADHLRRPSGWATWRSSASRSCPASSPRTRSSRPRSRRRAGRAGCSAAPRRSAPGSPRST